MDIKHLFQKKRDFLTDALHIFVLFGFALGQPLFDLLSRHPQFFVAHDSEPVDVILLVFILVILIPTLLVSVEAVTELLLGQRIRKGLHCLIVAGLVACIILPGLKKIPVVVPGTILLTGAALFGLAIAICYMRFSQARMFLTFMSPALFIFPGLFLLNSPASKIVFAGDGSGAVYAKVDATTPVVMVVFDELPVISLMDENRRIDPVRYPNFAALAQDFYWFRNATTVSAATHIAVPAILTGNHKALSNSYLPTTADYPQSIFTLLGGSYDLRVFETVTHLCPERLCERYLPPKSMKERIIPLLFDLAVIYFHVLLPDDLTSGLPVVTQSWKGFGTAPDIVNRIIKEKGFLDIWYRPELFGMFLESIAPTEGPRFYFLHIVFPHAPWRYLPSGKLYVRGSSRVRGLSKKGVWDNDEWAVVQGYQRHLLQVEFVDALVGRLTARLKAVNLYDRSLIVITADHGASFWPNEPRRDVSQRHPYDIRGVPLFIKVPNQREGVTSDRKVEIIDILPTIADMLGIRLPWPVDGRSILNPFLPENNEKVTFKDSHRFFIFDFAPEAEYASLKRKLALFGSGAKPDGLFKVGPHNDLVGRPVSELGVVGEADVEIKIDQENFFENLEMDNGFVPAQITGHVHANRNTKTPLNLAVVVNGTIRAVTRTFPRDGSAEEFSAMVPETSFRGGRNDVEVFVVSKVGEQLRLHKIKSEGEER